MVIVTKKCCWNMKNFVFAYDILCTLGKIHRNIIKFFTDKTTGISRICL